MELDPHQGLRALAVGGDREALRVLHDAMMEAGPLAEAFLLGRQVEAWASLRELGPAIREPRWWPQAWAVAWETMRRVRVNLVTVRARLEARGYRFLNPDGVLGAPAAGDELARLRTLVGGLLPLSLEAFWAVVGSVDFRQAHEQTVHDWLEDDASELERLGDDDPLLLHSVPRILESGFAQLVDGRWYTYLSPDAFHKANVSGGENYHVWLPDSGADVRLCGDVSPEPEGQFLVDALRRAMEGGGFRGRLGGDDGWEPFRPLHGELAAGLLPI